MMCGVMEREGMPFLIGGKACSITQKEKESNGTLGSWEHMSSMCGTVCSGPRLVSCGRELGRLLLRYPT